MSCKLIHLGANVERLRDAGIAKSWESGSGAKTPERYVTEEEEAASQRNGDEKERSKVM